jgi:arabinofuranosyltransferase
LKSKKKKQTGVSTGKKEDRGKWLLIGTIAVFVLFTWLVLSRAWFSDDAYFSFRSIDNFVNGYGLTWNVQERVQAFTHPLWVLVLSAFYFFTREIYLTTIVVSLVLSLALAWLIVKKIALTPGQGLAAVLFLALSTAFVDYSTSGLENPLSHLLLAIFVLVWLRGKETDKKLLWLAFIAALAAVNRLDTLLFFLPVVVYEWWQRKDKVQVAGQIALGFIPLAAWEIFSLIYYGFPFPNTYYAKAVNYVPFGQEVWAGLNYFLFTLKFDPITWAAILAAFVAVIWYREKRGISLTIGIALYLAYILQIGGDFMGGRFLSNAFLAATLLLLVYVFPKIDLKKHWVLIPVALALSVIASSPTYFLYAKGFETARWNGVVDERMVYHTTDFFRIEDLYAFNSDPAHNTLNKIAFFVRSVFRGTIFRLEAEHDWVDLGRELRAQAEAEGKLYLPQGANGFTGYFAGPDVYIIHGLAITDGFLARVPPIYNPNWRSGHFMRTIPVGYLEVEAGTQQHLEDLVLDAYYQKIRLVTEGPILSAERWQAIWELNTRKFEDWLPGYSAKFRFPNMKTVALDIAQLSGPIELNVAFSGQGSAAELEFPEIIHAISLTLDLSAGDNFELEYLDTNGVEIGSQQIRSDQSAGIEQYELDIPADVSSAGFAAIRIQPIRVFYDEADGDYLLSTIELKQ